MERDSQKKIFTIPNILSFFRLCLIPVIIWLYCVRHEYISTGVVLVLSGLTDIADGQIARRCHMISDLGKVLDPVADKLTQAAMLFCLLTRFPRMAVLIILMALKEGFVGATGAAVIRKTGKVFGADWHGKVATCLLYAMMFLHVVWNDIPTALSDALIVICAVMMCVSFVLYGSANIKALRGKDNMKKRTKRILLVAMCVIGALGIFMAIGKADRLALKKD